ncbi:MAG: iron ABC transporter permease [Treponema sp.]|jgi:iron complex transport system permease protein|nr:iron ABC transporter permease [Treponema sp.]
MKSGKKMLIASILALGIISIGTSLGSSGINIADTVAILWCTVLHIPLPQDMDPKTITIVWQLRFPRALLAFMVGGCLAISGAAVQSVLRNQLASPYILGVSSGASLGAGLIIITGFSLPLTGGFTLPLTGFLFGLATVGVVLVFASKIDKTMSNNTVILFGMVVSLFVNALLTTLLSLFREELKTLLLWMMGSFAMKGWSYVTLLLPFLVVGAVGIIRYTKEMDILTFGEDAAKSLGVDAQGVRKKLLLYATMLTGGAVSLSGAIGFVDLIAPHIARKIVGSNHRYLIPLSFIAGGSLMVLSDLAARIIVSPAELPVGAVTAIIGAPFFAWVYFRRGK